MGKMRQEVRMDRFHLKDRSLYILEGIIGAGQTVEAFLDHTSQPADVEPAEKTSAQDRFRDLYRQEDIRQVRVTVRLPENLSSCRTLTVYTCEDGKRKRWFRASAKKLDERRRAPQYFLEEQALTRDTVRIRGWAVDEGEVTIRVTGRDGAPLPADISRNEREDVANMFPEGSGDRKSGFYIELGRPSMGELRLVFQGLHGEAVHKVPLTAAAVLLQKAARYAAKGIRALETGGLTGLSEKVKGKLHERRIREIPYEEWLPRHLPSARELERQRKEAFAWQPLISVVVPLYRTPKEFLSQLVDSVLAQTYTNLELVLSDGSGQPSPLEAELKKLAASDSRIRVVSSAGTLGISENTNAAILASTGEYLAFADHDDLLEAGALYEVARALNRSAEENGKPFKIIYSDEDKVTWDGHKFYQPHFKPDYNEHLLCSVNYICHLLVMERQLVLDTGLLRAGFDGAQDHDLILRAVSRLSPADIGHIPKILYHWRAHEQSTALSPEAKNYAFEAGKRAIEEHYARCGKKGRVSEGEVPGLYRTKLEWEGRPLVSILIPNKDHAEDLEKCIASVEKQCTETPGQSLDYEYIIIENNSEKEETFRYYRELEEWSAKVRVVRWEGSFNFSAINNYGARFAKGEYLLFLNNDTQMIGTDGLTELLQYAAEPEVGAVGARLYYEDDTIQHAGVVIGFGGIAGHCFVLQPRGCTGYMHRIICTQEYSAVTAACMMVKREAFDAAGGFDEELAVAFNDIDLCLKLRQAGYLIVYNPYAELYHFESKSRGLEDSPEKIERFQREIAIFEKHWPGILKEGDPYYNPNLTLESQDFSRKRI